MYYQQIGTLGLAANTINTLRPQIGTLFPKSCNDQQQINSMKRGSRRNSRHTKTLSEVYFPQAS